MSWKRPYRQNWPNGFFAPGVSCWNCDHIQIRRMFQRRCPLHPEWYIWSSGTENERQELGEVYAEGCPDFKWAVEILPEHRVSLKIVK